jgi:hypothetical protein
MTMDDDEDIIKDEIVEKFILTFSNGDYDDELDDYLIYDRVVTLPARPTQASYNKPDNWRERNRIGLERLKVKLEYCIRLAIQKSSLRLNLMHPNLGQEPIVWHEQILDECWDQLEGALSGDELVTNIWGIQIENVEITKECLSALVAIIQSGQANFLSTLIIFDNANICGEGILCLSKLVDVSSNLQDFFLHHNRIDNIESARRLSRSLKSHASIHELHLTHCDLGSSPEILLVVLQSEVIYINLNYNNIDSLGAVKIAEYLEGDPPIEKISLNHNRLNDDDAELISQALKRNMTLTFLNLVRNNFTSFGVKALLTCVFDSSSLNALSESNHTLKEMKVFSMWETNNLNHYINKLLCIDKLLNLDRKQKITLALQDKDSLLQYLANIPVEVIPEVLAYSQQDGNEHQHRHLNIVYSTMRWWNMPLLYSHIV